MPALTRRILNAHPEAWLIHSGDIRVGTISKRAGVPGNVDQWGWSCGFYPGSHPGECTNGSASRSDFEEAWRAFLANRTEADFRAWRDQEAWTREKYRRFDRGERMPPDWRPSP
jgi:hypothetical protein